MVFYRKYRPQTIAELDLESVRNKLTSILLSDNIPHAFLFAGPKGLGKTSSARILAKAINCERRNITLNDSEGSRKESKTKGDSLPKPQNDNKSIEPCNKCSACVSITNGSAVDVFEIDAASNRGIDEIRDLKERIKFSPSSLQKKVYIIDEVHMLTPEAFNALLKTLEEPPSHVMFILATTELVKLPGTITSRTFYVEFKKPTDEELERSLSRVVKGENLDLETGVLPKIAELSDGAFRDGAKILEDLSLQSNGKKITLALLESLYKTGTIDSSVEKIVTLTIDRNVKEALNVIEDLSKINADFKSVIEKMANVLHRKLLDSVLSNKVEDIFSIQKLLTVLDEAYKNMKGTIIPSLPLEMAVIGYTMREEPITKNQTPNNDQTPKNKISKVQEQPEATSQSPVANFDQDTFKKLLELVNIENKILAGLLRGSHLEISGNRATLKPQSSFHMEKLSESKNKEIIASKLSEAIGKTIQLEFTS